MNSNNDKTPTYMNTQQAADLLHLSMRTLERMRVDGTGPRFRKAGPGKRSRVLYQYEELIQWLEEQTYQSTSEYV